MVFAIALKYALIALVMVMVVGGIWWAAKHPNRSKQHPGRVRMPIFIPIVGWLLLVVGFLMILVAFSATDDVDLLPMRIAAVAIFAGGLLFLLIYRNWYLEPDTDEVRFRTITGRERVIAYADIVDYRTYEASGQPRLEVRSASGAKLSINPQIYDVDPLWAAIAFRKRTGRWPLRGEAR